MKLKIACLIFALYTADATSQTLATLDSKNGFKSFILGGSITTKQPTLEYNSKDNQGIEAYKLTGMLPSYNDIIPKAILLDYYKNRLYRISIYFHDYRGMVFQRVSANHELLYGEPTKLNKTLTGGGLFGMEKQISGLINAIF